MSCVTNPFWNRSSACPGAADAYGARKAYTGSPVGLLFRSDGGTSSVSSVSYTFDANGNVSELLTDTGDIAAHYQYDPYGNTLVSEGELASDNVYRFSTKYTDTETKLLYYGFRYYSPELGRWPSRDPLGEEDCASLYLFVKGDPIRRVDDLGTLTIPWPTPWYTIQRRRRPSNDPRDVWLVGGEKFKYKDTFKVKTMGPPSMGAGETRCCEVMELYEGETHASLSNCSKENMPGWSGQNNPGTDTNGDGLLDNIGLDIGYDELQNPYAARNVTVTVYAFYDFCKGKKCDCVKMETRFAWWAPENGTRR